MARTSILLLVALAVSVVANRVREVKTDTSHDAEGNADPKACIAAIDIYDPALSASCTNGKMGGWSFHHEEYKARKDFYKEAPDIFKQKEKALFDSLHGDPYFWAAKDFYKEAPDALDCKKAMDFYEEAPDFYKQDRTWIKNTNEDFVDMCREMLTPTGKGLIKGLIYKDLANSADAFEVPCDAGCIPAICAAVNIAAIDRCIAAIDIAHPALMTGCEERKNQYKEVMDELFNKEAMEAFTEDWIAKEEAVVAYIEASLMYKHMNEMSIDEEIYKDFDNSVDAVQCLGEYPGAISAICAAVASSHDESAGEESEEKTDF